VDESLHPVKDAARQLGISIWTLRKKAYEGHIASVKIGAKLLIPESEMIRVVHEGMRPRRSAVAKSHDARASGASTTINRDTARVPGKKGRPWMAQRVKVAK
jgi:excisionase family DNA binding protein